MAGTAVKSRPILFSAPMVRAILDGRKTQTRRVVKPQPIQRPWRGRQIIGDEFHEWPEGIVRRKSVLRRDMLSKCPYGKPGDRIYVKETFGVVCQEAAGCVNCLEPGDPVPDRCSGCKTEYRADLAPGNDDGPGGWPCPEYKTDDEAPRWVSPLFMPRAASRITLEIVDVRVERVHEISEEDAIAEGVECEAYNEGKPVSACWWDYKRKCFSGAFQNGREARGSFRTLWDSINGKKHPWELSPWVWVISFKRVEA